MSVKTNEDAVGIPMGRQLIQDDTMLDQAGIAAALRRAFAARPVPALCDEPDDPLKALLKQIH